jgi:cytochrome P450
MSHTLRIIDARLAGGDARDDILSAWLAEIARSEDTLEGDAVRGEIIQMLFASHLTLPLSLIAVCHALARNRDIAAQIAAEAEGMDWTRTDLQYVLSGTMAMLAVKEALRLAPPAPILYREAGDTFDLEGFTIEAGQAVWVAPQLLHHDPRYFTRPDIFDPLRFRRDRSTPHSISAYMPFGTGPRTCIASRQSFLQMAMIALLVAEHVQLVPAANSEDQFKVLRHTP